MHSHSSCTKGAAPSQHSILYTETSRGLYASSNSYCVAPRPQLGDWGQLDNNTHETGMGCKALLRLLGPDWRRDAGPVKALETDRTVDLSA